MGYMREQGIVVGNVENKYEHSNFLYKKVLDGFYSSFDELLLKTKVQSVHEVGCGEGYLSARMADMDLYVRASDFSSKIIDVARSKHGDTPVRFAQKSIYELDRTDSEQLLVCCEVLEHLEHPEKALESLQRVAKQWCIFSVPNEPIWRVLNMLRGRYLKEYGNTPGHIQHWSKKSFLELLSGYFFIHEVRSPLPWTMALCHV